MNPISSKPILRLLFKWKFHLGIIVLLAGSAGVIFSGEAFLTPKYKSTAILYPANIIPFGVETPTEQILQVFQSAEIRREVCEKFKLAERYKIDLTKKGSRALLYDAYNENVDIRRTEYESVKIDVSDQDPQVACNIADTLIIMMNLKTRQLQRSKTIEVVKILKDQMDYKRAQIDSLDKALRFLRERYGVLDYYIQSKEVLRGYYKLIGGGTSKEKLKEFDTIIRNLEEKGAQSVSIKQMHEKMVDSYAEIKLQYDKAQNDLHKELTYTNVVGKPYPSDKKSYPVRWIIITLSVVSSLLFALIIIIFIENRQYFTKLE